MVMKTQQEQTERNVETTLSAPYSACGLPTLGACSTPMHNTAFDHESLTHYKTLPHPCMRLWGAIQT